jgi:hypothetical protein
MPQTPSTSTRLVALMVAVAIGLAGFVAGTGPAGAAVPTEAPTIIGPNGTSVGANPVLQWEPLEGVTKYRIQVATSASFSPLLWNTDVFNTSATPPTELPLGPIHWRVAGMDGSAIGPFEPASFTRTQLDGPQLLAPADESTLEYPSEPVILRWEAVTGIKNYKVEVDDAPDFIGAQTITTDATNWALLNTQALGQTFYWRVQGLAGASGVNTEYSETWEYDLAWADEGTPAVPVLSTPAAGATITDVVFRWGAVAGAAKYQIQVSPNGDWANNITFDKTVWGTSYSPPVTLNNASYFWRVRALSVRTPTDTGPWSPDGRQFTRSWADVPLQVAPDDGELAAEDFLLRWDPVPHAAAYEVQIGTDPNFSLDTYDTCTTNHTDWAPYYRLRTTDPAFPIRPGPCGLSDVSNSRRVYLRQGQRYYWRVRGLDISSPNLAVSALGRFSNTRNFIYAPGPGAPLPIGPTGTVEVPKLEWEPVPGVERYVVEVHVNGDEQITTIVHGTSYVPPLVMPKVGNVPQPAEVRWWVRGLQLGATDYSIAAGAGPKVQATPFTLTGTETTDAGDVPTLVAPEVDDGPTVQPEFDWTPVTDAHHYRVRLYPAGGPTSVSLGDEEQSATSTRRYSWRSAFTPTVPIVPGAYDWQVAAYTEAGTEISASERRSITIAPLDLAVPTAPDNCGEGVVCETHAATPLMRWQPVEWAAFYRVHVALDADFTNVKWIYSTTQTVLRPNEALPDNQAGQSYHWFVQPCRTINICGRFNSEVFPTAHAFRKASRPITLVSPDQGDVVPDLVTFTWQAPSADWDDAVDNDDIEARHYRIQVATDPGFSAIFDEALVDQTTYTPYAKTYPEGPLYWRVQAVDGTGNLLTFSEREISTDLPRVVHKRSPLIEVTSPSNGDEVNGLPVIQWEPQPFAAKYQVEYYRNGDTSWTAGNRVQTTTTQLAADTMVEALPPGTYAYRVRRVDVDGRFGPWSSDPPTLNGNPATGDRRTFVVVGGSPSPTAPANGAVFTRPRVRLEWDPVPGATAYRVETSATAGFGSLIENQVTVMTAWSLLKSYPNGTIHWRVSAIDAQGATLGTSPVRTFVHDLRRPTAAITSAVAGPASATVVWTAQPTTAVGPITSFVVTPYVGSAKGTPVTVPGTATRATVTGLINETSYRFTVTPYDADGMGVESALSTTVKPQAVAPFTSAERFIDMQFRDFYGRPPTTAEQTSIRTQLQNGTPAVTVINALWNGSPHAGVMPTITRLYSAFYVRIPDFGGLDYWAQQRRNGKSLGAAAEFFAKSGEFKTLYGEISNATYVDRVYLNVLGRPASASDKTYWTAELNSGRRTRGSLMIGFSEAAEYKTKNQHDINAALVLSEMLRRTPTKTERDTLSALLKDGQTMPETFAAIMATPEYDVRAT